VTAVALLCLCVWCADIDMQVHVDEDRYERYRKLGDMLDFVTTDGNTTQLHACKQLVCSTMFLLLLMPFI